jgi:hypothetical protein
MATANTADFLGGGAAPLPKAAVKAPKTNAAADAKARANIAATKTKIAKDQRNTANAQYLAGRAKDLKEREAEIARLMADPGPDGQRYRANKKFISSAGVDWGLIPMGIKVVGTGAAVIASGGAVAGVLGATAAGSAVAGATLLSKGVDAISTAQKVAGAAKRGDVVKVASVAASKGGDVINIKTKVALPKLPKAAAVAKPIAAKAKTAAKATKAAVKAVQKTSAAKVKAPAAAVKKAVAAAKTTVSTVGGTLHSTVKLPNGQTLVATGRQMPKPAAAVKPLATSASFAAAAALASVKPKAVKATVKPPPAVKLSTVKPPAASSAAAPAASSAAAPAASSAAAVPTVKPGATSLPKGARGFFVPVAGAQRGVAVYVGA